MAPPTQGILNKCRNDTKEHLPCQRFALLAPRHRYQAGRVDETNSGAAGGGASAKAHTFCTGVCMHEHLLLCYAGRGFQYRFEAFVIPNGVRRTPIKFGFGIYATAGIYRDCCATRKVKTTWEGEDIVSLVSK